MFSSFIGNVQGHRQKWRWTDHEGGILIRNDEDGEKVNDLSPRTSMHLLTLIDFELKGRHLFKSC